VNGRDEPTNPEVTIDTGGHAVSEPTNDSVSGAEIDISVRELQDLLRRGAPVRVLDVREEEAHREWRIPGSERLPWSGDGSDGSGGPVDCDRFRGEDPVVVVCARGRTSRRVAEAARTRCGADVRSLEGGMAAWSFAWNAAEVSSPDDDVTVLQLRRTGKGCLSYLVASGGEALVIDPSLEADVYLEVAGKRGWTIEGVIETHIHADHVSRGRRLAEAAGAPLHLPDQERAQFPHRSLADGDQVPVGRTRLTAVHTPGHTDESHSYLVEGRYLFTGDTLFLDAVGRPDLEARGDETQVRRHAGRLHASLSRLAELDPGVRVLPAHTSEPVAFDGEPVAAPLASVRSRVDELDLGEEDFVERLARATPPTPPNYERIVELNEAGAWPGDALLELEAGANRCAAG
jgi:glyoxylase-like metal-dependent hydrolase (beta-lactamase superfamily II)